MSEDLFLRLVKDRLKILLQREDDPLSIDYHLQSTDDQTNFLGRNDNGFTPLIAGRRNGQRIIWRFVYYPRIAGVFYISSEGTFWHFNNLPSNENVELISVNGDPSFADDPSNVFIMVNPDTPRYIQPYFHQEWYVQFDPFVIQPTLPVTNSVTAPYIGFNVTPV